MRYYCCTYILTIPCIFFHITSVFVFVYWKFLYDLMCDLDVRCVITQDAQVD